MVRITTLLLAFVLSAGAFDFFEWFTKEEPGETVSLVLGSGGAPRG